MASQGVVLDIDTKFIQNLERADRALQQSAASANALTEKFIQMANSSGSYSQSVQNIVNVFSKLDTVKFDPSTGLLKMGENTRTVADAVTDLENRTESLKHKWKEVYSQIDIKNSKGKSRVRVVDESELNNINTLTKAIANIDRLLTTGTKKHKTILSTEDQERLKNLKAVYHDLLKEARMTDTERMKGEVALTNKTIVEAKRRADAEIKEKKRVVDEAIRLARTADKTNANQLMRADRALVEAKAGLDPNIKSDQIHLQRIETEQQKVIDNYVKIGAVKKSTQKEALQNAKEARDLAATARTADELNRAYLELSKAKNNINPDTKRGQAELQRLEIKLDEVQKKMDSLNRSTPAGALNFAAYAETPEQLKQAQGYLKAAMGSTTDEETVRRLNDAWDKTVIKLKEYRNLSTSADNAKAAQATEEQYKHALALAQSARSATDLERALAAVKDAQTKFDTSTSEGAKRVSALANAEQRLTNEMAKQKGELTSTQQQQVANAQAMAENTNSVFRLTTAYNSLKNVAKNINPNTEEGKKNIAELEQQMRKLKERIKENAVSTDKFKQALSKVKDHVKSAFAMQALRQFASKLVSIHGEFEKINITLKVLLGSTAKAEFMWTKITELALKSPYSVQQLATATRQMAAYRIESTKLYQSTKMLADISAGLGVEINRLILAYGQVKAANFLRGTELRQFSEAGIDMLGQLAAYFSEIEGQAVSAAEVFDRISKRMVLFEDVDAVLHRITSRGGTFYEMQEQQANTLSGQISNLKDAIQLMFHDIGESNHELLLWLVSTMREIVENWEKWLPTIAAVVAAFVGFKTVSLALSGIYTVFRPLVTAVGASMYKLGFQTRWATAMMRQFMNMTPIGWFISLASAIGSVILGVTAFSEMGDSVDTESLEESGNSVSKIFSEMANEIKEAANTISAYTNTIDDYKSKLEDTNLSEREQVEYTTRLEEAIRGRSAVVQDLANNYGDLAANINAAFAAESGWWGIDEDVREEARIANMRSQIAAEAGRNYEDIIQEYVQAVQNVITQSTQSELWGDMDVSDLDKALEMAEKVSVLRDIVRSTQNESWAEEAAHIAANAARRGTMVIFNDFFADIEESSADIIQQRINELRRNIYGSENIPEGVNLLLALHEADNDFSEITSAMVEKWRELQDELNETPEDFVKNMTIVIDQFGLADDQVQFFKGALERAFGEDVDWDIPPQLEAWQQRFNDYRREVLETAGLTGEAQASLNRLLGEVSGSMTPEKHIEQLRALGEEYKKTIEAWQSYTQEERDAPMMYYLREEVEAAQAQLPIVEAFLHFYGDALKAKNQKSTLVPDLVSGIKEIHKAYKDLRDSFGEDASIEGAWERYGDMLGESLSRVGMTLEEFKAQFDNLSTEDSVTRAFEWVETLARTASDRQAVMRAKGEFIWETRAEIDERSFNDAQNRVEDLIKGYELSVELDKLHIPRDFADNFFDLNLVDLPQLRLQIMAEYEGLEIGVEEQREIDETLRRIDELEAEAQQERLRKYVEFARDAISERGKLLLEEAYTLIDIQNAFTLTDTLAKNEGLVTDDQLSSLREAQRTVADLMSMTDEDVLALNIFSEEEIANLREYNELLIQQRAIVETNVNEQLNRDMAEMDWGSFKESEVFSQIFNDLENASDSLITAALDRLNEFKTAWADMDLEEFSEVIKLIDKLEAQLVASRPAEAYYSARSGLRAAMRGVGDYAIQFTPDESGNVAWSSDNVGATTTPRDYNEYKEALEAELAIREEIVRDRERELAIAERDYNLTLTSATATAQDKENAQSAVNVARSLLETARANMEVVSRTLSLDEQRREALDKSRDSMEKALNTANDLYEAFKGLADVLFEEDSIGMLFADMGMQMLNSVANAIMLKMELASATVAAKGFGAAMNTAMSVIGWVVMGIQLLTAALTAAFKAHDQSIQKQIDAEVDRVTELQKAYKKLETQLDKVYSSNDVGRITREMNDNLQKQIAYTKDLIALEQAKKKPDEDQISGWEDELDSLTEQLSENMEEAFSSLTAGILDNVLDTARGFVDAWYEAFKDTGDGMSGLKDTFKDMLLDMLKQQASMNIMGKYVERYKDWLNKYIDVENGDDIFTKDEAAEFAARVKETLPMVNEELEGYFEAVSGILEQFDTGELSGLQKGIQGITEDQAEVLASYWNSCRFLLANIDTTLSDVAVKVFGDNNSPNSIIGELRRQTEILRNIYGKLDSVIKVGGESAHTGAYIKVSDM